MAVNYLSLHYMTMQHYSATYPNQRPMHLVVVRDEFCDMSSYSACRNANIVLSLIYALYATFRAPTEVEYNVYQVYIKGS